ncbi:metal-dependent transcriptional regulator [Alkaliphilus sp. MSJ-5]|uniref:Manganese transport regulator n=1 Tax=Alkaliphilus flagellatus TaxID=2841507 RepID=A0ABS6G0P2_9FIRM|nr:metal-dependent transcriptional regulator [Alkaliphilus flagellatus]MBU5675933.1 metal-dependent transcriptional regulator [Alkaliphilus flagellatus]
MNLSKSQSHYIKVVYELSSNGEGVRVCDIAQKMGFSKASVSLAMTKLEKEGLLRKDKKRQVFLTSEGEKQAIQMMDKFAIIHKFLTDTLKVDEKIAMEDACAIEHIISVDTLCALCRESSKVNKKSTCIEHCNVSEDNVANQ